MKKVAGPEKKGVPLIPPPASGVNRNSGETRTGAAKLRLFCGIAKYNFIKILNQNLSFSQPCNLA